MQFQKHNFAHNFLNAVETDKSVAWDVLSNEVNELILDHPKAINQALVQAGIGIHSNPSAKDYLDSIHDHFYTNEKLQRNVLRLIAKRHTDPHFSADGGQFDKVMIEGVEKADFNMSGDAMGEDEGTLNFIFSGAKNLVSNMRDRVQNAKAQKDNKDRAEKNLAAKEKQRNLKVSSSKGKMPAAKIMGITLGVVAAIGLTFYLIKLANKDKQATAA